LAVQVCSPTHTTVYLGAAAAAPSSLRCTVRLAAQPCSALRVHL
jgi:hypothetical protein